jgi:hypothetical protein
LGRAIELFSWPTRKEGVRLVVACCATVDSNGIVTVAVDGRG